MLWWKGPIMEDIKTTGGLFTEESRRIVLSNICKVFDCEEQDIEELKPVQAGLTNVVLSFKLNGGKYVYRHPGLGSEILVERGRETIMQKIVEDAGIDTTLIAMDVDEGWRIGRFIEHWDFDYNNLNDMVRAIMLFRRLHAAPCHLRWNFDVIKKAEGIRDQIERRFCGCEIIIGSTTEIGIEGEGSFLSINMPCGQFHGLQHQIILNIILTHAIEFLQLLTDLEAIPILND